MMFLLFAQKLFIKSKEDSPRAESLKEAAEVAVWKMS